MAPPQDNGGLDSGTRPLHPGAFGAHRPEPVSGRVGVAQLSELDRRLIRMLQSDGRRPFEDMARELKVDGRTVRRRVERLRDAGVVQITTVADPELLGYGASAMVGIQVDGTVPPTEIASELATVDVIDYVVVSTGRFHLLAEVLCGTTEELIETLEDRIQPLRGVTSCESFPYLRLYYQQPQWDEARFKRDRAAPPGQPISLDELDRRLIIALNNDGRTSFRRIAESLGVSEALIRQRVTRLTGSGAIRVMAITNPRSLGFELIAWLSISASPGVELQDLADRVSQCRSIAYLAVCAGRFDLFAEAICIDRSELLRLLDGELRTMPGVERLEVSLCTNLHYKRLSPLFARH